MRGRDFDYYYAHGCSRRRCTHHSTSKSQLIDDSLLERSKCELDLKPGMDQIMHSSIYAYRCLKVLWLQTFREAYGLVGEHLALRKVGLKGDPHEVPLRMMRAFCRVREIWGPPGNQMPELEGRMMPGVPHTQLVGPESDSKLSLNYSGKFRVVTTPSKNAVSVARPS